MHKKLGLLLVGLLLILVGCTTHKEPSQPTLLYFFKEGCPACETVAPLVDQITSKYEETVNYQVVTSQTDDGKALIQKYGIEWVPTWVVLSPDGEEVGRLGGTEVTEADFDQLLEAAKTKFAK